MAGIMAAIFPTPLSPDEIGGVTIAVGLGLPVVASVICYAKGMKRVKDICAAWLSYGFTASPLVLLCFNSISSIIHGPVTQTALVAGENIASVSPLFGAAPATMAFSAGYAILHLTSDLHTNIKGKSQNAQDAVEDSG